MADKNAYESWGKMAEQARNINSDSSLQLWQKAHMITGAYAGLEISSLRSKHRHHVLNILAEINDILKQYNLESFDDYQNINDPHLQEIIQLAKTLSPPG